MTDASKSTTKVFIDALTAMIAEAVDARLEDLGLFEDEEATDEFTETVEDEESDEEFSEEEFEDEESDEAEDEDEEADEEDYQPWSRAELQRYDKPSLIGVAEEDFELDVSNVKTKKALIDAILDYQDELLQDEPEEEEEPEPEPEPEPVKPKRRPARKPEVKKTGKKTAAKAGKKGVGKYLK